MKFCIVKLAQSVMKHSEPHIGILGQVTDKTKETKEVTAKEMSPDSRSFASVFMRNPRITTDMKSGQMTNQVKEKQESRVELSVKNIGNIKSDFSVSTLGFSAGFPNL
eukprot:GFUD01064319.1.p1 GENE.GFUD01064319.1~~GFUD01064319.1.p1  ORF type:complete len:108 (+),score=31.64 GFUD01064319.1:25-348(+)